ncbi:hypothetical protein J5N97_020146 [Dioscorea zingiberensis]|uniref:Ubiquitin-like-conjugating enzyme ATG10 n=1 Tax=Dioscorea zingiberensis TaxID=325984 RepID=A0A9D5CF88_9LILI|nr:hypothetical protein J5N97_020146 [Dioscorea zingiberensis]
MGSSCKDEGYLSLENMYHLDPNEECISVESFSNIEETDDEATLVHCSNNTKYFYDFHIVYSFSYRVPVLYFRGYRSDGQPMNLDDIENDLPCSSSRLLRESKWTYMTQEEHPYLHRPWFTLHACATRDWMKLLLAGTSMKDFDISHYLPSWLSVVGQAVGLRIPLELQQSFNLFPKNRVSFTMSLPGEQQQPPGGYQEPYRHRTGGGSIGPVIAVLAVIAVLGVIAGVIGRLCSGRRVWGCRQYDFEGWIERKCASCIDGRLDHHHHTVRPPAPPPPPPPDTNGAASSTAEQLPEVKPPETAAPTSA